MKEKIQILKEAEGNFGKIKSFSLAEASLVLLLVACGGEKSASSQKLQPIPTLSTSPEQSDYSMVLNASLNDQPVWKLELGEGKELKFTNFQKITPANATYLTFLGRALNLKLSNDLKNIGIIQGLPYHGCVQPPLGKVDIILATQGQKTGNLNCINPSDPPGVVQLGQDVYEIANRIQ